MRKIIMLTVFDAMCNVWRYFDDLHECRGYERVSFFS